MARQLLGLLALAAACTSADHGSYAEAHEDAGGPRVEDVATEEQSYANVRVLFGMGATGCATFGCHANGAWKERSREWLVLNADGTTEDRFRTWAIGRDALVCEVAGQRPMKRVDPGWPETSSLVHVLRGTKLCGDLRMPPAGPYLSEAQIALVEQWIRGLPEHRLSEEL